MGGLGSELTARLTPGLVHNYPECADPEGQAGSLPEQAAKPWAVAVVPLTLLKKTGGE